MDFENIIRQVDGNNCEKVIQALIEIFDDNFQSDNQEFYEVHLMESLFIPFLTRFKEKYSP